MSAAERQSNPGPRRGKPAAAAVGPQTPSPLELKINSDPANLRQVRKQMEYFAQRGGWPRETCDAIGLVVNEALANVIRHGYGGATDRPIIVTAEQVQGELRISIRDWAKPFDPSGVAPRHVGDLRPGGLGLLCMQKLMDEVRYERLPDGMLLKLVKKARPG
jgi:anti-sigma regulatory factor (Ser/Thr protein kinase)